MVDLLPYMRGDGRTITLSSGEHVRTIALEDNQWLIGKNYAAEHLGADNDYIYRFADTSATADEYYETFTHKNGARGHIWCKRHMQVGDVFESKSYNIFRYKGNWTAPDGWRQVTGRLAGTLSRNDHRTDEQGGYTQPFRITLVNVYPEYTFVGRKLPDVAHLLCEIPVGNGTWRRFEEWLFAKNIGLVAWGEIEQKKWNYYDGPADSKRVPYAPVNWWLADSYATIRANSDIEDGMSTTLWQWPEYPGDGWQDDAILTPIHGNTFFTLRTQPFVDGTTFVRKQHEPLGASVNFKHTYPAEGTDSKGEVWIPVLSDREQRFWVAKQYFIASFDDEEEPAPEPEPQPEPEPTPGPVPPVIDFMPLEIMMNLPVNYWTPEQRKEVGKQMVLEGYAKIALGYALQDKLYSPTIVDSAAVVDKVVAQAKKKITQTMYGIKAEDVKDDVA